jgi:hypothetical protein
LRGPRRVLPWLALLTASGAVAQLPKAGHELQVNTYTTSKQEGAAVAMHADGAFVVVWGSSDQDGNKEGVFGQRFSSSGASQAVEFQVNAYTTGTTPTLGIQDQPQVAPDGDGGFIVVWRSFSQDGNSYGVFARRFDDAGAAVSGDFQVNSYVLAQQAAPAIASDGDGDFVVAWQSFGQDKSSYGIFARRFDSQGEGLGIEFQVNQHTSNAQYAPAVGIAPDDGFVIVWESSLQDGGAGPGGLRAAL